MIQSDHIEESVRWNLYEEFLNKLKDLFQNERAVISDAHSDNIKLCLVDGEPIFLIVDGKVAGFTTDLRMADKRLRIKLSQERKKRNKEHCWLLWEYRQFIRAHMA